MDHVCYHARTHIILGIGLTAENAIVDARYNATDPDVDTSAWRTAQATDALTDRVRARGGDCDWALDRNTGVASV